MKAALLVSTAAAPVAPAVSGCVAPGEGCAIPRSAPSGRSTGAGAGPARLVVEACMEFRINSMHTKIASEFAENPETQPAEQAELASLSNAR